MSALQKNQSLKNQLIVIAVLFVIFIVLILGVLSYEGAKRANLQRHLELSSSLILLSQQMATYSLSASSGVESSFDRLEVARSSFDSILGVFDKGNVIVGAVDKKTITSFLDLEATWRNYRNKVEVILDGHDSITKVTELYGLVDGFIPKMLNYSDEIVSLMISKDSSNKRQIYLATRQMMLSQRIKNNLNRVLEGGESAAAAADRFGRDAALYGRVLDGLLNGSTALRVSRVSDSKAVSKLRESAMLISAVSDNIAGILELSPEIFEVKDASGQSEEDSVRLLDAAEKFQEDIVVDGKSLDDLKVIAIIFGIIIVLLMIVGSLLLLRDARTREDVALANNRRNQRAILRLLDEMANLADGDLTVHATVTEDITGAIADSVNFTIDELRSLVTTINSTAAQVSSSTETTKLTVEELMGASDSQAREIVSASAAVSDMAESMSTVSQDANNSARVAQKSMGIAQKGADVVRNTIGSMEKIRENIQETSKRIKRLGESSQEIGDIVGLITEIADQTNILALNAAIQASTAGDAGRGFAVVADEVQRLAERAGNATKQIEGLVNTIQSDTNEAVKSMEMSTAGVVSGALMAEDAGIALKEIENVSAELSHLIENISNSTKSQSQVALSVAQSMNVIQEVTVQVSEGTDETSSSLSSLNSLSTDLRRSVASFKLPDASGEETDSVATGQG